MKKLKNKKIFSFREKISQCRKKLKGGTLWDFSTSILSQNIKKMQGGPFEEKNFEKKSEKKCLAVPKKIERGESLVSPGMICYAEKQVKPFWSSSLGQMVLFDTIIFCRTFKNYFGQFVWIEKKVTIIVAFHFMKRRLKINHRHSFNNFYFLDNSVISGLSKKYPRQQKCMTNSDQNFIWIFKNFHSTFCSVSSKIVETKPKS